MAQNAYWNKKTGTGWKKGADGKWYQYKNFKKTGNSKKNLTLGSGVAKAISSTVKKAQSSMKIRKDKRTQATIGSGTAKNPQYKRHQRSGKLIPNPSYTPPTKTPAPKTKASDSNGSRRSFQNRVSGNGGSSKSTETKVTKEKKVVTPPKKDAWKTDEAKKWLGKRDSSKKGSIAHKLKKAGFTDKERWLLQKQHREWKAKRGR
jgi:hypothetical protein